MALELKSSTPGTYHLGERAVVSVLPKRQGKDMVMVGPRVNHREYLRHSNQGSHYERFNGNKILGSFPEGGMEILTVPASPYVEGPNSFHIMLVSIGKGRNGREKSIPTFADYAQTQGEEHLRLLGQIGRTLQQQGENNWFFGTSYNMREWNRQAVQSVKTIHTHIVVLRDDAMGGFINLSEEPPSERKAKARLLSDSFAPLSLALMQEMVFTPEFMMQLRSVFSEKVTLDQPYPKGLTFAAGNGMDTFDDPALFQALQAIDQKLDGVFRTIANIYTDRAPTRRDAYNRYGLRSRDLMKRRLNAFVKTHGNELSNLTVARLQRLGSMLASASDIIGRAATPLEKTLLSNTRLFLMGPAYNRLAFPNPNGNGEILFSIVPRALSGGSPLDAMGIYKDQFPAPDEVVDRIIEDQKKSARAFVNQAFHVGGKSPASPLA